jgi:hypothetical protein
MIHFLQGLYNLAGIIFFIIQQEGSVKYGTDPLRVSSTLGRQASSEVLSILGKTLKLITSCFRLDKLILLPHKLLLPYF